MRRNVFRRALGAILLLTGLAAASVASAAPSCTALPEYVRRYLRDHVRYHELTPELEKRSIENHLLRLDPSRTLMTKSEFEQLAASMDGVFDSIKRGNCKPLTDLHKKLLRRHEYAAKFVKSYVDGDDYVIDETAELTLNPEDRGHPKTEAERDDLLRLLVHFQMSTYVSNDTKFARAKKKLVSRYDRRFRRFRGGRGAAPVFRSSAAISTAAASPGAASSTVPRRPEHWSPVSTSRSTRSRSIPGLRVRAASRPTTSSASTG